MDCSGQRCESQKGQLSVSTSVISVSTSNIWDQYHDSQGNARKLILSRNQGGSSVFKLIV